MASRCPVFQALRPARSRPAEGSGCHNAVVIDPSHDAFGAALLDYLEGKDVPGLVLEVEGGGAVPAMHPEWFFRDFGQ